MLNQFTYGTEIGGFFFTAKFSSLTISKLMLWNILEMNNHSLTSECMLAQLKLVSVYVAQAAINYGN